MDHVNLQVDPKASRTKTGDEAMKNAVQFHRQRRSLGCGRILLILAVLHLPALHSIPSSRNIANPISSGFIPNPMSFMGRHSLVTGRTRLPDASSLGGSFVNQCRSAPWPLILRQNIRNGGLASIVMQSSSMFGAETVEVVKGDRAIILGVDIKKDKYKTRGGSWELNDSLDELERLCETAGMDVVHRDFQNMQNPSSSTFIGSGKVEELAIAVKERNVQAVVFDDELSPGQQRNLQKSFGSNVKVIDRTQLILQIFSQRARTREAKLQVQAAQMKYMLPRLQYFMTQGAGMDAKGGGKGLKGAGETQVEMDRRLFKNQISKIEKDIEDVRAQRDVYRAKRRERDNLPIVAIVGYTNAGKSTMLNKMCGSEEVYADDLLFATLDPTSRKIRLPGGRETLITDTVGFIQKLPTKLVSSFRATLEELEDASLILHVVDASSPLARQQVWSVQSIIEELMVEDTPQIMVFNKIDRVKERAEGEEDPLKDLALVHERVVPECVVNTSAKSGQGVQDLILVIEQALLALTAMVSCIIPYSKGDLLNEIHKSGTIVEEEFIAEGTRVVAYVPPSLRGRLADYIQKQ